MSRAAQGSFNPDCHEHQEWVHHEHRHRPLNHLTMPLHNTTVHSHQGSCNVDRPTVPPKTQGCTQEGPECSLELFCRPFCMLLGTAPPRTNKIFTALKKKQPATAGSQIMGLSHANTHPVCTLAAHTFHVKSGSLSATVGRHIPCQNILLLTPLPSPCNA